MNEQLEKELKRLDFDGSGKVDISDAAALLNQKLAGKSPATAAGLGFIAGIVCGFIAGRGSV